MRLSFPRSELLTQLQLVARATAVRSAIQTLAGIKLEVSDGNVDLAATDTEIALRSSLKGSGEGTGTVVVPGRLLVDILRVLDGNEVMLEQPAPGGEVRVTSGNARFSIRSLPAEDFPRLPEPPGDEALTVPAQAFAATVDRVARAASRDETRPVLTGILVSVDGSALRMVATDSYRLSVKETPLEREAGQPFEANVPARALQELGRVVNDRGPSELSAAMRDNQIVFGLDGVTVSSRMIDGQFPNYRQLLPESYEHEIKLARVELANVVRRVSLMAQRNAPLRLGFESGELKISAQTPDVGEASETLPVSYSGDPLEIGFNPQFLQDGLEGVEADDVVLKLISPLRPGLIEAAPGANEESNEAGKFIYLIMPVRLNV